MHGSDASGQRGSEETWPPDVWEAELTLAYSQQVQVARCWQKGVAVWKVAVGIFCFFWQVWSFGVFWSEDRKEKNQLKKTNPLLVVLSRCLLGLLFRVGEICTICLEFYFTFCWPCVHKYSERQAVSVVCCGDIPRVVAQEMSWCTVAMTLNTCLSA